MSTDLVTVDIGGTHARFAIAMIGEDGAITLGEPETLHTDDHASFQTAWEDFRKRMGGTLPPRIAMAIAGPVGDDVIRFTNNPWIIRPALVRQKLGVVGRAEESFGAWVLLAVVRMQELPPAGNCET